MADTITVALEFDFKGRHHALKSRIDLSPCLRRGGALPDLHLQLARDHGIDRYSYEYEIMQLEEPRIVDAEGLARDHLQDGRLDWAALCEAERDRREGEAIRHIAREQLGIDDLQQQPGLRAALLAAYHRGFEAGREEAPVDG